MQWGVWMVLTACFGAATSTTLPRRKPAGCDHGIVERHEPDGALTGFARSVGGTRRTSRRWRWSTRSILTPIFPRSTTCTCRLLRVTANRNASAWTCFATGRENWMPSPWICRSGPDYVVGPGDGLAINLWGGVSQRMIRSVDREGRITLPEAGPVLVSGRTLGEVQESVQQVLRTQFRDVSADVSLSRLRTIRVYRGGRSRRAGRLRHQFAFDAAQRAVRSRRNYPARFTAQPETLPRQATHRRSRRLRPAAARRGFGPQAAGEWRLSAGSADWADRSP